MSLSSLLQLHQQQFLPVRYIQIGQPKFVITNNHLITLGESSLTYFKLTNWIEYPYPIIRVDLVHDYLPFPTTSKFVYNYYHNYPTLEFINITEAVPIILNNLRPKNFVCISTLIHILIGFNEKVSQDSRNNLIKKLPLSSNSEYSIVIIPHWWVLLEAEFLEFQNNFLLKNNSENQLEIVDRQLEHNIANHDTYKEVLQKNMKFDCNKMEIVKEIFEINLATEVTYNPQKRFTTLSKNIVDKDKLIMSDKSDEMKNSTADFIARAARRTLSVSSPDSGISVEEFSDDFQSYENTNENEIKNINKKSFNEMAEDFCFGPLEESSFLVEFDEYCKSRKRMEYTRLLIDKFDNGNFNNIDDNLNACSMNVFEEVNNCNNEINLTVLYDQYHFNQNY